MVMANAKHAFDPIAVLQALDEHGVVYIIVGALGRVIHGTGELTADVDIVPAMAEKTCASSGSHSKTFTPVALTETCSTSRRTSANNPFSNCRPTLAR
jgi:hypothetical protein